MKELILSDTTRELTVVNINGEAKKIDYPKKIAITGTLKAPFQYISEKMSGVSVATVGADLPLGITETQTWYNERRSTLLVDKTDSTLKLILNEKDPYSDEVTGQLERSAELDAFGINTDKQFNLSELIKVVKRNKFYFVDAAEHQNFLQALQNFNAHITTVIQKVKTDNGNQLDLMQKTVAENKNAPSFKLEAPIYIGYPKRTILVRTCLEASMNSVLFYFESEDLFTLLKSEKEQFFNDEIEKFTEQFACAIVEVG